MDWSQEWGSMLESFCFQFVSMVVSKVVKFADDTIFLGF